MPFLSYSDSIHGVPESGREHYVMEPPDYKNKKPPKYFDVIKNGSITKHLVFKMYFCM